MISLTSSHSSTSFSNPRSFQPVPPSVPSSSTWYKSPPPRSPLYKSPSQLQNIDNDLADDLDMLKLRLSEHSPEDEHDLSDQDLVGFYKDMIAASAEVATVPDTPQIGDEKGELSVNARHRILKRLRERLLGLPGAQTVSSSSKANGETKTLESVEASDMNTYAILSRSRRQLAASCLEQLRNIDVPASGVLTISPKGKERDLARSDVSLGLVSMQEWRSLFDESMALDDVRGAELVLEEMIRHGVSPAAEWLVRVVNADAGRGHVGEVTRLQQKFADHALEIQEDLNNALVTATLRRSGPKATISLLQAAERQSQPLPQSSYAMVLSHLTVSTSIHRTDSHSRALGRDLFAHMRLMAHPHPSRELYRTMILACAENNEPQPERARDLWLEMTTDGDAPAMQPQREDYDAIIRAMCTTKDNYLEGFELFRQMLAKHHDATIIPFQDEPKSLWSGFVPSMETFEALLQGTKRAGDLERTRWVVLEMVKLVQAAALTRDRAISGPTNQVVESMFHAYATWRPKRPSKSHRSLEIKEETNPVKKRQETEDRIDFDAVDLTNMTVQGGSTLPSGTGIDQAYRPTPLPRNSREALREASAIYDRIVYDTKAATEGEVDLLEHPFHTVSLDRRILHAFQSVILTHAADIEEAREFCSKALSDAQVALGIEVDDLKANAVGEEPQSILTTKGPTGNRLSGNGQSYLEILKRSSWGRYTGLTASDKIEGLRWAKAIWPSYRPALQKHLDLLRAVETMKPVSSTGEQADKKSRKSPSNPVAAAVKFRMYQEGYGDRDVEKAWKATIRLYALNGDHDSALGLLNEFHSLFPPSDVLKQYIPRPTMELSMRMDDPAALAEPDVPPHLLFQDVQDLFNLVNKKGLVDADRTIRRVTNDYLKALTMRRNWRVKNRASGDLVLPDSLSAMGETDPILGQKTKAKKAWKWTGEKFIKDRIARPTDRELEAEPEAVNQDGPTPIVNPVQHVTASDRKAERMRLSALREQARGRKEPMRRPTL